MKGGREKTRRTLLWQILKLLSKNVPGHFPFQGIAPRQTKPDSAKILLDIVVRRIVSFEFLGGLIEVPFDSKVEQHFNYRDWEGCEFMFAGLSSVNVCRTQIVDRFPKLAGLV